MSRAARKRVAIFGGSGFEAGEGEFEAARQLGAAIAARGWAVVNGGYGGAMLASAVGAAGAGGHVIGVTCRLFKSNPNEYIHEVVEVEDLHAWPPRPARGVDHVRLVAGARGGGDRARIRWSGLDPFRETSIASSVEVFLVVLAAVKSQFWCPLQHPTPVE